MNFTLHAFSSYTKKSLVLLCSLSLFVSFLSPITNAQNSRETPRVQLITVDCGKFCETQNGLDWSKAKISNGGKYVEMICGSNLFGGRVIQGIADYADGISKNFLKNNPLRGIYYKFNPHRARNLMRNCAYYWQKSQNARYYTPCLETAPYTDIAKTGQEIIPRNTQEVAFLDCDTTSVAINNNAKSTPIFAYQFRYNLAFETNNLQTQSQLYSQMTGKVGTYEGVLMTYTYYTYQKGGIWENWQNPNSGNTYGGWLIYALDTK